MPELGLRAPVEALDSAIGALGRLHVGHLAPTPQGSLTEPVAGPPGPCRWVREVALLAEVAAASAP
eukprot:10691675-Alexandrium_andersonii.AAC.2